MALKKCPDCGSDISTEALACPKCGRPNASAAQYIPVLSPEKKRGTISTGCGIIVIFGAIVGIAAMFSNGNDNSSATSGSASGSSVQGCEPSDFVISHVKTSWDSEGGAITLTALVTNNCAEAAGPELTWTAYYGDGSVAFAEQFWPASTVNIAPHQSYHVEDIELARPHKWKYTLEVSDVRQWGAR